HGDRSTARHHSPDRRLLVHQPSPYHAARTSHRIPPPRRPPDLHRGQPPPRPHHRHSGHRPHRHQRHRNPSPRARRNPPVPHRARPRPRLWHPCRLDPRPTAHHRSRRPSHLSLPAPAPLAQQPNERRRPVKPGTDGGRSSPAGRRDSARRRRHARPH